MAKPPKAETIISTAIPSVTKKATITFEPITKPPPYTAYGRKGIEYSTGVQGVDIPNIMLQLSTNTNATWLWWTLVENRNVKTNITCLEPKHFTSADIWKIKRGRKSLEDLGLIKRYKNNHYLINPKAVFPLPDYYESVCLHWFSVTGEDLNTSILTPVSNIP